MFELSVKTATGKEFEVCYAVRSTIGMNRMLYIEFDGKSMMDIVPVFSDVNEISTIYGYVAGELTETYIGYTKLAEAFFVPENETHLRIRLDMPVEIEELGGGEA